MRHFGLPGLFTPPASPTKDARQSSYSTESDTLTGANTSFKLPTCGLRSLSLGLLTPPASPHRHSWCHRRAVTSTQYPQLDGGDDTGIDPPQTPTRIPQALPTASVSAVRDTVLPDWSPRRADLTSPKQLRDPIPNFDDLETPTRLTRVPPAEATSPVSLQRQQSSPFSPLLLRKRRPNSLPGQRPALKSFSRPRRVSGPDRFIPDRRPSSVLNEDFRLARSPERLTDHERAIRRRPQGSDPFRYQPQRPTNRSQTHGLSRTGVSVATGANSIPIHPRRGYRTYTARQVSDGGVWNIGGAATAAETISAVHDGRGGILGSGTNAPLHTARFLTKSDALRELDLYEQRLALAFDIDPSSRILGSFKEPETPSTPGNGRIYSPHSSLSPHQRLQAGDLAWRDSEWIQDGVLILDAPSLRDDFYCSLLAYSVPAKTLAVGLGHHVYLWSEGRGVETPESLNIYSTSHLTSICFSSTQGRKSILAVGRADGRLVLWSSFDHESRFTSKQQNPISCLTFRPHTVKRPSNRDSHISVDTEELLVGDELGHVYYYAVEWPDSEARALFDWQGSLTLLARIPVHAQQVCGLAWSHDGELFASGGNDNLCVLFESKRVVLSQSPNTIVRTESYTNANGEQTWTILPGADPAFPVSPSRIKHQWLLNAAVKAIAFCPWQRGLIAIGGGSNDRCIHFYHTVSGACLATIDCSAQITSLIWSTTRHELCATFGFAQPEHPYRIAVFAWPSCEQVIAIPWFDEHRALHAISYPGGPSSGRRGDEGGRWWQGTAEEGCVVVATSDASIKFHEVWSERRRASVGGPGLLGGSDILESLHGVDERGNGAIR